MAAFERRRTTASPERGGGGDAFPMPVEEHVELHMYVSEVACRWVDWTRCNLGSAGGPRLSLVVQATIGFLWYLLASFTP